MSAIDEWAARELAHQDANVRATMEQLRREDERRTKFCRDHPWLARLRYGRDLYRRQVEGR